jgi:hypothetical protein
MSKGNKHSLERNPDFNFKTIEDLQHLSFEEKEKILHDLDYILNECEISKKTILEGLELEGIDPDLDWLKRVNYKISIKRKQKKMLQNHLRVEKGESLLGAFFDISKIMLPEETFNSILRKSKELVNKTGNGEFS